MPGGWSCGRTTGIIWGRWIVIECKMRKLKQTCWIGYKPRRCSKLGGVFEGTWGTNSATRVHKPWCFQQLEQHTLCMNCLWDKYFPSNCEVCLSLPPPPPTWVNNIKAVWWNIRNTLAHWGHFEKWLFVWFLPFFFTPVFEFPYIRLERSLCHAKLPLMLTLGGVLSVNWGAVLTLREQIHCIMIYYDLSFWQVRSCSIKAGVIELDWPGLLKVYTLISFENIF